MPLARLSSPVRRAWRRATSPSGSAITTASSPWAPAREHHRRPGRQLQRPRRSATAPPGRAAAISLRRAQTQEAERQVQIIQAPAAVQREPRRRVRRGSARRLSPCRRAPRTHRVAGRAPRRAVHRLRPSSRALPLRRRAVVLRTRCRARACAVATSARPPGRFTERVTGSTPGAQTLSHTSPTGFSSVPPPGPATPVTPTPTSAPGARGRRRASAARPLPETAPCASIISRGTPVCPIFTSLE